MLLSLAQLQDLYSQAVEQLVEFITSAITSLQSCVEGECCCEGLSCSMNSPDPSSLDPVMVECLGVVIETLQLLANPKQHCCIPQSGKQ